MVPVIMTRGHGLGRTCAQVLQLLQSSTQPLTVVEIAESMHLHKNSVRFHLDSLIEMGFASRSKEHTGAQGRPRLAYFAAEDSPIMKDESLLDLFQVILRNFVMPLPDAEARAHDAGVSWGANIAAQEAPSRKGANQLESVGAMMTEQGFTCRRDGDSITFTRCPYLLAAVDEAEMVAICALHHGMVTGYVNHNDPSIAPDDVVMEPRCTITVRT